MKSLYSSPLRVYLCLGALALIGIFSGFKLPISLFPNSSKPSVAVNVGYGNSTADTFLNTYGRDLEGQLQKISKDKIQVESVTSDYHSGSASYRVHFKWGADPDQALRETQLLVNAYAARFPKDVRDSVWVSTHNENSGFFALSFYSPKRGIDEIYSILEPALTPKLAQIEDAEDPGLWNPNQKEIRVELQPDRMASLQLFPADIERAINQALTAYGGGSIKIGSKNLSVELPKSATSIDDLAAIAIPAGIRTVHLGDVAKIDFANKSDNQQSFKTSGAPSIILFSKPKPGGNVKHMSEEILRVVDETLKSLPSDLTYKSLVDPSEFIRSSVQNVFKEVLIGSTLAVCILFLFIGSFKNTITAAIEIPLSMILAFILMKLSGMNLNLISLGGLALSAGMNVDASVVVMENIFRHFEESPGPHTQAQRIKILTQAVNEVKFSVIASTIASLVVFLPLVFTSELTYAILGDLAKTVVFSHGCSAVVALVLVPTVRLQLMSRGARGGKAEKSVHSPIERQIRWVERTYAKALDSFLRNTLIQRGVYASLTGILILCVALILPRLPKEIIGKPDTDWVVMGINVQGLTQPKQLEALAEKEEARLLEKFGNKIQYTFNQIFGTSNVFLMARLKDKREMSSLTQAIETEFTNSPAINYWVDSWNPAELPIPDPPNLKIDVHGSSTAERAKGTQELLDLLQEKQVLPRLWSEPNLSRTESILLKADPAQWQALQRSDVGSRISLSDLTDITLIAANGKTVTNLPVAERMTNIVLHYPENTLKSPEDLGTFPIGLQGKIFPLRALAPISIEQIPPPLFREDGHELFAVFGKKGQGGDSKDQPTTDFMKSSKEIVKTWQSKYPKLTASFEDAEKEMNDALSQLKIAVALSIGLMFLTLVLQFGDVINSLLVLVAVPLGIIGVLLSLLVFKSTLSLNSALGVILLNGIAVANSIILVDFLKRRVDQGLTPHEAALDAAQKRLRPILITSLTTILGMTPIALGLGEGGRVLQPLGIAVAGGLWVSMALTLFVVPALQVSYLNWKRRRTRADAPAGASLAGPPQFKIDAQPVEWNS